MNTPDPIVRKRRRLPINRIEHKNVNWPKLSKKFRNTAARSSATGLSYALKICTMYERIANTPVNCCKKNNGIKIANGLRVDFRFNSDSFSRNVGNGCEHFKFCLMHVLHEFERILCRCRSLNSCAIASAGTHPRSQRSDFFASFVRFFDRSHCGVSGI